MKAQPRNVLDFLSARASDGIIRFHCAPKLGSSEPSEL